MTTITDALRAARACIQQDRTSLADTGMRHDNTMDPDAAARVAEYDAVLQQIDAALAGMTHHITDEQIVATSADELLLKVYELLWGEHPECCGNPEAVGYFGDSPAIDCCRCPNYARLNDAQIVASLRALIKESDLMSLLGMRAAKTTPLADWSVDVFDDEEGRTYINIRNPDDDVAAAGVIAYVVGNRRTLASQVLHGFRQAFHSALTAAPTPPAQPDDDGDVTGQPGPLLEHGWDEVPAGAFKKPSPTHGMNLGQRIKHVGGRENAQGYIEFGSVAAVRALILQWLRDMPPAVPEDVARVNQQMLEALKASRAYIARYGYTGKQLEIIDAAIDAARAAEKGGE